MKNGVRKNIRKYNVHEKNSPLPHNPRIVRSFIIKWGLVVGLATRYLLLDNLVKTKLLNTLTECSSYPKAKGQNLRSQNQNCKNAKIMKKLRNCPCLIL